MQMLFKEILRRVDIKTELRLNQRHLIDFKNPTKGGQINRTPPESATFD
jgi:hypothetical protein